MKLIYSLLAVALIGNTVLANGTDRYTEEVTFIKDAKRVPDATWQKQLRSTHAWQSFLDRNGTWYVEFDESNLKPHHAYGQPIPTTGANPHDRAMNFLSNELSDYGINASELTVMSAPRTSKHVYMHFKQKTQGLEVLGSRFTVKMDQSGNVISFTSDVYDMAGLNLTPSVAASAAEAEARIGLNGITGSSSNGFSALPVPAYHSIDARLVYNVEVHTMNDGVPGHYVCYVDAHSGELLYRSNTVMSHDHSKCTGHKAEEEEEEVVTADVALTGTVFEEHPFIPSVVSPLSSLNATIGGQAFQTDVNGMITSTVTGPVMADFSLSGSWSTVRTGGVTPTMSVLLQDGPNAVSFDNDANSRELSAYFHVNIVHDHVNAVLPNFTGMDFSLTTNVDEAGNCNAFYDGSSINFLTEGNDCQSFAQVAEVVYHEYGHGINDNFYQSLNANFSNGAMNEGYADIWALTITLDGILAEGSSLSNAANSIRRYDINPKVFPADLVGQVHADGEIIAGAWWDTYLLLGNNLPLTLQLFADAFSGLQAATFNGNEGVAYRDVLIDVLEADDNDNDITNGTPNGNIIVEAFAIHGITLLSNAELDHIAVETAMENQDITLDADLILQFPFTTYVSDVTLFYRVNGATTFTDVPMANVGGNTWEADIPGQAQGSVIAYYLGVSDIFGQLSGVTPLGASKPGDPNLPNFVLVDMQVALTDDLDSFNELGNWTITLPTDDATTGQWDFTIPIGSFLDPNDPSTAVQPDFQNTPNGEFCFVTGNAASPTDGIGVNDVDAGTTTLLSDIIDLSSFTNPVITYYRWWSNNTGALPNEDPLEIAVSDDGGNTWTFAEFTRTSDRSWRRNAFRVQDFVNVTNQFRIKFNASDSVAFGGSLVEAAIDDIQVWENAEAQSVQDIEAVSLTTLFPDPASDLINVSLQLNSAQRVRLEIYDMTGRVVKTDDLGLLTGREVGQVDVRELAEGQYSLKVIWENGTAQAPFLIVR